jgi:hypothetical protein
VTFYFIFRHHCQTKEYQCLVSLVLICLDAIRKPITTEDLPV